MQTLCLFASIDTRDSLLILHSVVLSFLMQAIWLASIIVVSWHSAMFVGVPTVSALIGPTANAI